MLRHPRFKPHYVVRVVEDKGVLFYTESGCFVLHGANYARIANAINAQRTTFEIIKPGDGPCSTKELEEAMTDLEKRGLLCEASDLVDEGEAAFWWMQDLDPYASMERLKNEGISVRVFGNISTKPFLDALEGFHIRVRDDAKFGVVLTDDYLSRGLIDYNNESLSRERSWMLIKPVGSEIWIGPLFIPGRTGCWECLAARLRSNRNAAGESDAGLTISRAFTPATLNIAFNLAALNVAKWIVQEELPGLQGQILVEQLLTGNSEVHRLVWRPQCPACGDPLEEIPETVSPLVLHSTKKLFTIDGGHRVMTPEATYEKYRHHVSRITGVIKSLDRHTISTNSVHVYGGSMNCILSNNSIKMIQDAMTSSGKGASDAQARTSGLCESLERYCGIYRGDEPRKKAKLKDLGGSARHPYDYMQYSKNQYENRDSWNASNNTKLFVPYPFDEEIALEWSPAWSLTRNEIVYLPTSYCYYFYPGNPEKPFCTANSNGNAAGNTIEEAMLQGFFELVERDAVGIWWFNKIRYPLVDWMNFDLPYLEEVQQYHRENQREIWVLDITTDIPIPTFVAVSRKTEGPQEKIILGFGAHMDSKIALLRAMTELNQGMVWTLETSRHPVSHSTYKYYESLTMDVSLETITLKDLPQVVPDTQFTPRCEKDYKQDWSDDMKQDILTCKEIIEKNGMEWIVLDQTRADVGIPVVKVIIPGMRHFWPRFAPGRLYDVPVKMGRLSNPLTEEELNPIMVFS